MPYSVSDAEMSRPWFLSFKIMHSYGGYRPEKIPEILAEWNENTERVKSMDIKEQDKLAIPVGLC